jgi:hypothetical protein
MPWDLASPPVLVYSSRHYSNLDEFLAVQHPVGLVFLPNHNPDILLDPIPKSRITIATCANPCFH